MTIAIQAIVMTHGGKHRAEHSVPLHIKKTPDDPLAGLKPSWPRATEDPKQTGAGLMESRRSDGIRIQDNNRRFSERMVFTSEDTP